MIVHPKETCCSRCTGNVCIVHRQCAQHNTELNKSNFYSSNLNLLDLSLIDGTRFQLASDFGRNLLMVVFVQKVEEISALGQV